MTRRMDMNFVGRAFSREKTAFYLVSGEFPYYRMNAGQWKERLEKVRELGVEVLSFYVPWGHHAPTAEGIDLTGVTLDRRDVVGFANLAASLGFSLIIKPGPFICAEFHRGGIPDWLMEKHPEIAMHDSLGRDVVFFEDGYALPDLLHPTFLKYVEEWYRTVTEQLLVPLQTQGALAAVQVDNEFPFSSLDFIDPFSWGYSPQHVDEFAGFVVRHPDGKLIPGCPNPPTSLVIGELSDWRVHRLWAEYKEQVAVKVLETYSRILLAFGVQVPLYHDLIMLENESPTNFAKMSDVLPVCPNYWFEKHPMYDSKTYARCEVRTKLVKSVQQDKVLYASETNWCWGNEEEFSFLFFQLLPLCAGINIYCVVDGGDAGYIGEIKVSNVPEPYPGYAPISESGEETDAYHALKSFIQFLERRGGECGGALAQAKERSGVLLGNYTPYNHPQILLQSTQCKEPKLLNMFKNVRMNTWLADMAEGLIAQNIPFQIADLQTWTLGDMLAYDVLFVPAYSFMESNVQKKLVEYVKAGGTLFLSPQLPEYDLNLNRCTVLQSELFPGLALTEHASYHNITWDGFGYLGVKISPFQHVEPQKIQSSPDNTTITATLWNGSAIGLKRTLGQGQAYWLGSDVSTLPHLAKFMSWFCALNDIWPVAEVTPEEPGAAAEEIHVSVVSHAEDDFIRITNRSADPFSGRVRVDLDSGPVNLRAEVPAWRGLLLWYRGGELLESFVSDFRTKPRIEVLANS